MVCINYRPLAAGIAISIALCPGASGIRALAQQGTRADAQMLTCPVTHLPIASPAVAVGRSVYHGKIYYFCTSNCKRLFDKHPAKYAKTH